MRERDIDRKRQEVRRLFALFKLCCCCLRQKGVKSCACARRRCPLRVHRQSESTAAAERANELQLLAIRASVCLRVCVCKSTRGATVSAVVAVAAIWPLGGEAFECFFRARTQHSSSEFLRAGSNFLLAPLLAAPHTLRAPN